MDIKISIVITARNYSKYLKECINSCINQTVKPFEIIYSDDYSTDNSIKIAKELGCIIVRQSKHVGVIKARNAGVTKTRGNILVHVDGDDTLTPDFLEKHLEVFDRSLPFTYCAAQAFGNNNHFWRVPNWDERNIWDRNYVNTSAMIWKDKFLEVGGWLDTCENTMWDWSLAIRLSRLGKPRKSSAILNYRQHRDSWSNYRRKKPEYFTSIVNKIRRELITLTVGLVYSGRLSGLLDKWFENIIEDVSILNNKPEIIIINNSEKDISNIKDKYKDYFSSIRIITGPGKFKYKGERDRRNKVCELLSDNYNRILDLATGDLIHLREDDILSCEGSFKELFNFLTETLTVRTAVAGPYANRNHENRIVGGYYDKQYKDITKLKSKPLKIDFTGTGYILFWKNQVPIYSPYFNGIQAHDWAWGIKLKNMGKELWMLPNAPCKHYLDEKRYLLPQINNINMVDNFTKKTSNKGTSLIKKTIR